MNNEALAANLQEHPELVAKNEKERLLVQERLLYNRSKKFI
jgi:hypothetical protein